MIRALFFDLDGTLCDTSRAFALGRDRAFAALRAGRPSLTDAAVADAWDAAHRDLHVQLERQTLTMAAVRDTRFRRTLSALGMDDDDLADRLNRILSVTQLRKSTLFPDAAALDTLRNDYFLGIITNGADDDHPDSQRTKVRRFGLERLANSVTISDSAGFRKPDPRIFRSAMDFASVVPDEAVYVGDSPAHDVAGAHRAGMISVLVARHVHPVDLQGDERPDAVIGSLYGLPALLGESGAGSA